MSRTPAQRPDAVQLLSMPQVRTKARELGVTLDYETPAQQTPPGMPPVRVPDSQRAPLPGKLPPPGDGRRDEDRGRDADRAAQVDDVRMRLEQMRSPGKAPGRWDGAVVGVRAPDAAPDAPLQRHRYVPDAGPGDPHDRDAYLAVLVEERRLEDLQAEAAEVRRRLQGLQGIGPAPVPATPAHTPASVREPPAAARRPASAAGAAKRVDDGGVGAAMRNDLGGASTWQLRGPRPDPVHMPAAGGRRAAEDSRGGGAGAPWALDVGAERPASRGLEDYRTVEMQRQAQAIWQATAVQQHTTYGRRTAGDLMPAVPGARGPTGSLRPGSARGAARYAGPTYEPTVVSTTTAATSVPAQFRGMKPG